MYSVTIHVPEGVDVDKRPRPVIVKFKSKEEKDEYVRKENSYCEDVMREHAKAWTPYQRKQSWMKLYSQRKAFHDSIYKKQPTTKDVA